MVGTEIEADRVFMAAEPSIVTRFAPSPTGLLHLGHAYAAIFAHDLAREHDGRFLLRIEDIDTTRCRPEFEEQVYDDLAWLGLHWDQPVRRQSDHLALYRSKLEELSGRGLLYPCFCTRREIAEEIERMPSAPHGPEGPVYPGTCRMLSLAERDKRLDEGMPHAWRLNIEAALERFQEKWARFSVRKHDQTRNLEHFHESNNLGNALASSSVSSTLSFIETGRGAQGEQGKIRVEPHLFGDIVLGRKDLGISYHLAVTLDDHLQGVTVVTRGEDLFDATHVQRLLQELLGLDVPAYHHHRLIRHETGRRLAKRDKDLTIKALRTAGASPGDIREKLGLTNLSNRERS